MLKMNGEPKIINTEIAQSFKGLRNSQQTEVDSKLVDREYDKSQDFNIEENKE